jgi:hypothetical protein
MAGLSINRLVNIFKRAAAIRRAINNRDRKKDLEREDQIDINIDEYAQLFSKDMEELKQIAQQKNIPNTEEFNKEELVMAIEFADLAEEQD